MQKLFRIGVFYDGNHFVYAQNYLYGQKYGWLSFRPFHKLLEEYVRKQIQGDYDYKVVYSAWYQGLFSVASSDEKHLKLDRQRHLDLLHAGIDTKYQPMSHSTNTEKGIDVAMAIKVLEVGLANTMDLAILVTGDGDFVPLVQALMKNSIQVAVAYFDYEDDKGRKSFCNERLKEVCSFELNINSLENDREFKTFFSSLFIKPN
jgi:uncharacterized LabA/DUF88 family protein